MKAAVRLHAIFTATFTFLKPEKMREHQIMFVRVAKTL